MMLMDIYSTKKSYWYPNHTRNVDDSGQNVGRWSSVLVLVFFVLSSTYASQDDVQAHVSHHLLDIAVIAPVGVPIPQFATIQAVKLLVGARIIAPTNKHPKQRHIRLNLITVPLFSVLLLLAAGVIDGTILRKGIVGADGIKPLDIMALFISLVSPMRTWCVSSQRIK
jgi:hypothetical protein